MTQTTPDTTIEREVSNEELTQSIPRYHVVLFDDNDHTYEYVVEMLTKLLDHSR